MDELSPLDILGQTFSKRLHGFAPDEVQRFLSLVASTMENALRDRGELRQKVHTLENDLAVFKERESALHEALMAAQRSADETKVEAETEGAKILSDAQGLADNLIDEANDRARAIELVIADLRTRRREARSEVMRFIELLQGLVDDDKSMEKVERTSAQVTFIRRPQNVRSEG